ncbi:hypothetical protein J1614_010730 [Plenodomus biglobosus]|nr:hypothetical protein J1614_010730 [Plenodomus biglobosus]
MSTSEPNIKFTLAAGVYDQIEKTLPQDAKLSGYVKDKIRYDYDEDKCKLRAIRDGSGSREYELSSA